MDNIKDSLNGIISIKCNGVIIFQQNPIGILNTEIYTNKIDKPSDIQCKQEVDK